MTPETESKCVVVGIDGSQAAISAARWAVDEAVSRHLPLRLVYVTPPKRVGLPPAEETLELALRQAEAAVEGMGKPVEVESAILHGRPDRVLIEESLDAAMVCVGSVGRGSLSRMPLGSTAAALAKHSRCPVAIVPAGEALQTEYSWIAAALDDEPDNDAVVHRAMSEARLRQASVLLIDRRANSWIRRYPDVPVHTVAENSRAARCIQDHDQSIQLVIVGSADAENVAQLADLNCHPVLMYTNSTVLLVRHLDARHHTL